jgi:hypothetical protein
MTQPNWQLVDIRDLEMKLNNQFSMDCFIKTTKAGRKMLVIKNKIGTIETELFNGGD